MTIILIKCYIEASRHCDCHHSVSTGSLTTVDSIVKDHQLSSTEVMVLKQKETFTCASVSYDALASIIGYRPNLHTDGTTAGDSIFPVQKSSLKDCPRLASTEKHAMLGPAFRVSHLPINYFW